MLAVLVPLRINSDDAPRDTSRSSYTQAVFNERQIGRAAEFFAPDVTGQGGLT